VCARLKTVIQKQCSRSAIQAAYRLEGISRETVSAMRHERDRQVLTAGHQPKAQDLEKQKEGKKRMRRWARGSRRRLASP